MDRNNAFLEDNFDPEIIVGAQQSSNYDSLSDTLIYQPNELPQSPIHSLPEKTLVLHHSNSFSEMIETFSDPKILNKTLTFKHLLPDNVIEMGTGSSVIRDVYSSFWAEFYEHCTLGTTLKVPFVRHDFCAATWKAIGRILFIGFQDCQYWPIKLAPPFLEEMLYGTVHSDLKTSFLQFVSSIEQEVILALLMMITFLKCLTDMNVGKGSLLLLFLKSWMKYLTRNWYRNQCLSLTVGGRLHSHRLI